MSDLVVDSSVVAKWLLSEADSAKAHAIVSDAAASGAKLIVLDLVFPEVANAIWKRHNRGMISEAEARLLLNALVKAPVEQEAAIPHLSAGFEISLRYRRAVYDALFVALATARGLRGVTADEPLYNAVHTDFPNIVLLRDI